MFFEKKADFFRKINCCLYTLPIGEGAPEGGG